MSAEASALCIIPARGGSRRIPRKNLRPFRGRPILLWSIEAALESGAFQSVMVSTDDEEIADIARAAGAEVPFLRSQEASDDFATTADVLLEVFGRYEQRGDSFALACCLYPTAPFATAEDLRRGRAQLLTLGCDALIPVAAYSYPIWRSLQRDPEGRVRLNFPENLNRRSQDLPPAYHDAGQWYWFLTEPFLRTKVLLGESTGSVVLPALQVQDIDTEEDWLLAELKHERFFG